MTASSAVAPTEGVAEAGTRSEHDLLGHLDVPADAYYGVHTVRAADNFPITGITAGDLPDLHQRAGRGEAGGGRRESGHRRDRTDKGGRDHRCPQDDVRAGRLHEQFIVDMIQGGAGTSTNMNANEVIANRALEHLGHTPR